MKNRKNLMIIKSSFPYPEFTEKVCKLQFAYGRLFRNAPIFGLDIQEKNFIESYAQTIRKFRKFAATWANMSKRNRTKVYKQLVLSFADIEAEIIMRTFEK